jgi:ribosomal protein S18 acetylase RimI-like enzyme
MAAAGHRRQLLRHIQATAQTGGLQTLWLEVLTQNTAGRRFTAAWDLSGCGICWVEHRRGTIGLWRLSLKSTIPLPYPVRILQHFHDVRAPWQRDLPSLRGCLETLHGLGYWEARRLVGYVLYQMGETDYAIYDLAVAPTHPQRIAVAQALLMALHAPAPTWVVTSSTFPPTTHCARLPQCELPHLAAPI